MWALPAPGGYRFGFTSYAIRLLQDVYFLAWSVDAGTQLRERQAIGEIESSKAESELYAPMAGTLSEFNLGVLADPSAINIDGFGRGLAVYDARFGRGAIEPSAVFGPPGRELEDRREDDQRPSQSK